VAQLEIIHAFDPLLLLEHAADGFLTPVRSEEAFPTPPYLLVLRQGGLRDDLLALAARRGVRGWFDPPLCTFEELPSFLVPTDLVPCGDYERLALITTLLRQVEGQVFARLRRPDAYADALERLFGELAAEGVEPAELERCFAACTGRDAFQRRRDAEIVRLYAGYTGRLAEASRRDGRDARLDCARALRADADGSRLAARLRGRREVRILGLQDLRGGWRALLAALVATPALDRVRIYTSVELELDDLAPIRVRLDEPVSAAALLFGAAAPAAGRVFAPAAPTAPVAPAAAPTPAATPQAATGAALLTLTGRALDAPDTEREVEEVARRVRELVEGGVAPHRIAVVARQARPHLDLAVEALERFGLPVTARRRIAYREIPVIRALLSLFTAAAEGWGRHGLVEIAEQPYFSGKLDAHVLNWIGYRRRVEGLEAWSAELTALLERAEARERADAGDAEPARGTQRRSARERPGAADVDGGERGVVPPPASRVRQARAAFEAFRQCVQPLDGERTLGEWIGWLTDLVREDPWGVREAMCRVPAGRVEVARPDLLAWRGLERILREWAKALESWGGGEERLDAERFAARLVAMLDGEVALWTATVRGVQVLEALAAAYRSFDHVFLIGLEAGRFPVHAPRSPVLDDEEREALAAAGLPLDRAATWDTRERELFRVLVAGARERLTLSWARLDGAGRETVRSIFVELLGDVATLEIESIPTSRVRTPALPLCPAAAREHALAAARIERARAAGLAGAHDGRIQDAELLAAIAEEFGDARIWSPTQLESYARCPWAFFADRLLGLERLEEPDADLDPRTRGTLLHRALQLFYDRARDEYAGGPVFLRAGDETWAEPLLLAALDQALAECEDEVWLGHPALRDAKREELRRILRKYLAFEIEHGEKHFNNRANAAYTLRTGVVEHELAFKDVELVVDGTRVRFRGFIDRVEVGIDERVAGSDRFVAAVDYKTTKSATPAGGEKDGWEDGVVLQVPLYAYALTQLRPGAVVSRVEYRALKQACTVHALELEQVDRRTHELLSDDEAREKYERALDAVAGHVRAVRAGCFPARPAPSCGCPPFCTGRDICRVPGGPRSKRDR